MPGATALPRYDVILVGSGFASSFFLHEVLRRSSPRARILVLERGALHSHESYVKNSDELQAEAIKQITEAPGSRKSWMYLLAHGGGSNCWWANTPRMTPADFELRSRFGVGQDWPVDYDDLEEYYCRSEDLMAVSGPTDHPICPRSRPYPQPPHRLSEPDRILKEAHPSEFFELPTARARVATAKRPPCCGNGICNVCPIDAKFTVRNDFAHLYEDPRVTLIVEARVDAVEMSGGLATGVVYTRAGREERAGADLIVLGANAIFNPHILLRSGITLPALGRGLVEQVGLYAVAYLRGVSNFQGSSSRCGHGYMLHRDADRKRRAAGLFLTHNTSDVSGLRQTKGKWRQILGVTFVFEDLRQEENRVMVNPNDPSRPRIVFGSRSPYAMAALNELEDNFEQILAPLPLDGYEIHSLKPTEAHIIGTTVMGDDPATSVVDRLQVCHGVPNLVVLGSGSFPTAAPANPTLTICALALWSADRLLPGARLSRDGAS